MPDGQVSLAHAGEHYEPLAFGAYDILLVILAIAVVFAIVRAVMRLRDSRDAGRLEP